MKRYVVSSDEAFSKMLNKLEKHDKVGFDCEFKPGKWATNPEGRAYNFAVREGNEYTGYYVPTTHQPSLFSQYKNYSGGNEGFWKRIKLLLENPNILKVCHSAQVESGYAKCNGVEMGDAIRDTEIETWLFDENPPYEGSGGVTQLSLKSAAPNILGKEFTGAKLKLRDLDEDKDIGNAAIEDAAIYGTNDAINTLALHEWLQEELAGQQLLREYEELEIPYVRVLRDLVLEGVPIDLKETKKQLNLIEARMAHIEKEVRAEAGEPSLNLASTQQLSHLFFEKLHYQLKDEQGNPIPPPRTTPSKTFPNGQYKMDEAIKEALAAAGYPLGKLVNEHTKLGKFAGTYHRKYLEECINGKYYPKMRQCATVTGRLGSDFQQVHRPDKDRYLPCGFCVDSPHDHRISVRILVGVDPDSGEYLISADYSQLELRLLAHFTQDPVLLACYLNGEDLHEGTKLAVHAAAKSENASIEYSRSDAKPDNFGIVYGLDIASFISRFGEKVGRTIHKYLTERFAGVEKAKAAYIHQMHLDGYVRSLAGRKRRLHMINHDDWKIRGYAERQGWNDIMQASGRDIVAMAQVELAKNLPEFRQCLQSHDELTGKFRGTKKQVVEIVKGLQHIMENIVQLSVPLVAEPGIGFNWLTAKK